MAKHCKKHQCEPLWDKTKINSFHQKVELIRLQETIEIFKNKNDVNDEQPEYLAEAWKAAILKNTKGKVRVEEHPQSHPMDDRMEQTEASLVKQPIRNSEICASND